MKITRLARSGVEEQLVDPKSFAYFIRLVGVGYIKWVPISKEWVSSSDLNKWSYGLLGYVGNKGTYTPNYVFSVKLISDINPSDNRYNRIDISLSMQNKIIATWNAEGDSLIKSNDFRNFMKQKVGLIDVPLLHKQVERMELQKKIQESKARAMAELFNKSIRMTRRSFESGEARDVTAIVRPKEDGGHEIGYSVKYLESGQKEPFKIWRDANPDGTALTKQQASDLFDEFVIMLRGRRFVDESSFDYIPEDANNSNWDFAWNKRKDMSLKMDNLISAKSNKEIKESQDYNYEGFYSGDIPDSVLNYIGSPSIDAGQIKSMFGKSDEAINLVNQFDSSLLRNILFAFNFGKGGAYGVYLSELDRAIKTKILKKKLEQKGYEIEVTEKGLTAFPKDGQDIPEEQIQKDRDSIYQDLQSKGGMAIGVNMNAVLNASKTDAMATGIKDPNLWEWMAILHLGSTIVHEAIHARGARDEGSAEAGENSFIQWALPKINEKFRESLRSQGREDEYVPLTVTTNKRHAVKKSWYRQAQGMAYYLPEIYQSRPLGSDLKGRFPYDPQSNEGMADWSKISQYYQNSAIETRLGRQFMSPLPPDLDQLHDSIEEQLRKNTRGLEPLNTKASLEELLSLGHDKDRGYLTMEGLLDEKRPHPLMVPLQKSASINKKAGTRLNLTPFMVGEIAIDFEYYDEHYEEGDPQIQVEKNIHEKLMSGNFDFTNEEILAIGQTLKDISDKDIFSEDTKAKKQLWDVEFQLGMWKPISDERAKDAVKNGINVKMSHFPKINGVRYEYNFDWDSSFSSSNNTVPISSGSKVSVASKGIIKTATLFGWMNNLEISDGSTIPGLGDRVMEWEDRDEDFSQEEKWIRNQPRYNPEYDVKGFFYRWIEPRFKPQLFDDMTREYSNTHPAKRFASKDNDPIHGEWSRILSVLSKAKQCVLSKNISTRFILSEDVMPIIDYIFGNDDIKLYVFEIKDSPEDEKLLAVWVTRPDIDEIKIERAEKHIQKVEVSDEVDSILNELFGQGTSKKSLVEEIVKQVKYISEEFGFNDVRLSFKNNRDGYICFDGDIKEHCFIIGEKLAEKLKINNVQTDSCNMSLAFDYNGIKVLFNNIKGKL